MDRTKKVKYAELWTRTVGRNYRSNSGSLSGHFIIAKSTFSQPNKLITSSSNPVKAMAMDESSPGKPMTILSRPKSIISQTICTANERFRDLFHPNVSGLFAKGGYQNIRPTMRLSSQPNRWHPVDDKQTPTELAPQPSTQNGSRWCSLRSAQRQPTRPGGSKHLGTQTQGIMFVIDRTHHQYVRMRWRQRSRPGKTSPSSINVIIKHVSNN